MAVRIKVNRRRGRLSALASDTRLRGQGYSERAATIIEQELRKVTPVDTGRMRRSTYVRQARNRYRVGYGVAYAAYAYNHHRRQGNDFLRTGIRNGFRRFRRSSATTTRRTGRR